MKTLVKNWFAGPKDVIALIITLTYCVAFLLTALIPGIHFDAEMGGQYEHIMLMVISFYFGSKTAKETKVSPSVDNT
jgi:hypothetical protein